MGNLQEPKQQDAGVNGRARPTLTSSLDCQEHLIDGEYKEYTPGSVCNNGVVMLKSTRVEEHDGCREISNLYNVGSILHVIFLMHTFFF